MSFRPITKDEALAIHSAVVARFGGTADGAWDFEPLAEWVQTVAGWHANRGWLNRGRRCVHAFARSACEAR